MIRSSGRQDQGSCYRLQGWMAPGKYQNSGRVDIKDPGFEAHLCRLALKGTINLVRLFSDL